MRARAATALLVGVLCIAGRTQAAEDEETRPGLYLGVGGLFGIPNFQLPSGGGIDFVTDASWGLDSRFGYRLSRMFAAEGQFQYYGNFGLVTKLNGQDVLQTDLSGVSFSANGKVYPFVGAFKPTIQPYGLGGVGFLHMNSSLDESATEFMGRVGGGVDVYATPNLVLNFETSWVLPTGDLADFRIAPLAFGVQYRFD
jgi:opacity protein-like surface antigen